MDTLYCTETVYIAQIRTQISVPSFRRGQESESIPESGEAETVYIAQIRTQISVPSLRRGQESESIPESFSGNVNEALRSKTLHW